MRRTIAAVVIAGTVALALTACGDTKDCSQYPTGSADYFACEQG